MVEFLLNLFTMNNQEFKPHKNLFLIPSLIVFVIWLVYWIEIQFGLNFNKFGVFPRNFTGFRGVLFSHFIHSDTKHLFNNSVPLFVLILSLFSFYKELAWKVLLLGSFLTGLITWSIGRESYHIGASGIVYLLFSFVFFSGIIRKHFRLVALSLIIIFLYGSMVWYIFPIKKGMSWEGHLSGFLVGLLFAFLYKNKGMTKKEFQFSKTDFDDMFDENGNFNPPKIEEDQESNIN